MHQYVKIALSVFVCLVLSFSALGQDNKKDKLQRQKVRLQDEIELANKILKETKKSQQISVGNIKTVEQKLKLRRNLIRTIDREIGLLDKSIIKTNQEIDTLQKRIEKLKTDYANMIRQANKSKNKNSRLMFILSSRDFNQALRRLEYLKQYSEFRRRQVEEIKNQQLALNTKVEELNHQKVRKGALKSQMEKERAKLLAEKEEQEKNIENLKEKESEIASQVKAKQAKAKQLEKEIQRIIAAEIRKARERAIRKQIEEEATLVGLKKGSDYTSKTKNKALKALIEKKKKELSAANKPVTTSTSTATKGFSLTPEAQRLDANFTANKSRLPWPVERGLVVSTFGSHRHPIAKSVIINNNGIDIATEKGGKARAAFDGEVISSYRTPGAAFFVIVNHGSYYSIYQNLAEVYVSQGDKVSSKQALGLIYTNDKSNETSLHFEIWKIKEGAEPKPVNPLPWLTPK